MEEEKLNASQKSYTNLTDSDLTGVMTQGEWRNESAPVGTFSGIGRQGSNNQGGLQAKIREELTSYFIDEGGVDWQWDHQLHCALIKIH